MRICYGERLCNISALREKVFALCNIFAFYFVIYMRDGKLVRLSRMIKEVKYMMKKVMIGIAFIMAVLMLSFATDSEAMTKKTKEYRYDVNENGDVEIIKYTGKKKKVTVPARIDGKDVVFVEGFRYTHVTNVTIPDSVMSIGDSAFEGCKKLKKVKLSKKITTIPWDAFRNCDSLTTVNMSGNISKIGYYAFQNCGELLSVGDLTLKEIEWNAFENCKKLAGTITLDSSIENIPDYCFYHCKKLDFRIPDKDWKVGEFAFAGCPKISKRYLSPDVSADAYAGCANIDTVIVKDDNVVEENGIYYSKDKKTLIYVRPDYSGTLDFLKQVETIGAYAFSGFRQKKVKIPDNIREIKEGAFYGAKCKSVTWNKKVKDIADNMFRESALEKVVIPKGVKTIGCRALWDMAKCVSVSLSASVQSWADYAPGDDFTTGVLEGFPRRTACSVIRPGGKRNHTKYRNVLEYEHTLLAIQKI